MGWENMVEDRPVELQFTIQKAEGSEEHYIDGLKDSNGKPITFKVTVGEKKGEATIYYSDGVIERIKYPGQWSNREAEDYIKNYHGRGVKCQS